MGRKKIGHKEEAVTQSKQPSRKKFITPVKSAKSMSSEDKRNFRNDIMNSLIEANRQKFGVENVLSTSTEMEQLIVGVPTPSLAFEYLIMNDVFPLKTLTMVAGKWGSCKTSLALEFFRWVRMADGFCAFINTEQKFDADLAYGLLRETPEDQPFLYLAAGSVEKYQQMLTLSLQAYKKIPKASEIPGIFCIDSLASATSESTHEKIEKDGHASKGFAVHALLNKEYISKLKNDYAQWPISIVFINHIKDNVTPQGIPTKNTLGGQAVNYHESFEIHSTVRDKNVSCANYTGTLLELQCVKNSYGRTGNKIPARFLHTIVDDENGVPQDVHYWDWNWSIVALLHGILNDAKTQYGSLNKKRLQERGIKLHVEGSVNAITAKGYMPNLGMEKSDSLPISELGQKIHENQEVCDLIRDALNIKRRVAFAKPMEDHIQDFVESAE